MTGFIANLAPVPRKQVERDLDKLETRGLKALPPLTGNIEGPVWELRSKVEGHGLYRIFYYRDGAASFHAFYAYQKKEDRLPKQVRAEVLGRYEQLTGKKP
ncbi:MAG TPA: type II toxin-antitoxin system RelE/ParE family toxin [Longimicrobiaceae bacterium]